MRNFDPAPLFRASVGFDRMADMIDRLMAAEPVQPTYPPYNIEKTDENAYRISVAVAGFAADELNVEVKEGALLISARKAEDDDGRAYLHRGIATRAFERRFQLADHVKVTGATHVDGMLHVDLVREIPEALKPRRIEISGTRKGDGAKLVEGQSNGNTSDGNTSDGNTSDGPKSEGKSKAA